MQKMIKVLLMCVVFLGVSNAYAATINGSMAVNGGLNTNGQGLADVTDISLTSLFGAGTGVFDLSNVTMSSIGTGGSVSMSSFAPVNNFISVENWSFDLLTLNIIDQTAGLLTLKGTGLLNDVSGVLASSSATWELTTTSTASYGITVTTVPVPAAVWLFGSGLIGLAGIARRKV